MAYTTPLAMLRYGAAALAQLCTAQLNEVLDHELLEAALNDEDLSAYSAAQQELVADAVAWIQDRIDAAARKVDSYIGARYTLPLTQQQVDASILPNYAQAITYHQMMINGPDEIAKAQYEEALRWLKDVSRGLAKIGGAAETEAAAVDQHRLKCSAPSGIDWRRY